MKWKHIHLLALFIRGFIYFFLTYSTVIVKEKLTSVFHKLTQPTYFKYTATAYCIQTLPVPFKILMDHSI